MSTAIDELKEKGGKKFCIISIPRKKGKDYYVNLDFGFNLGGKVNILLTPKEAKILASRLLITCKAMES